MLTMLMYMPKSQRISICPIQHMHHTEHTRSTDVLGRVCPLEADLLPVIAYAFATVYFYNLFVECFDYHFVLGRGLVEFLLGDGKEYVSFFVKGRDERGARRDAGKKLLEEGRGDVFLFFLDTLEFFIQIALKKVRVRLLKCYVCCPLCILLPLLVAIHIITLFLLLIII